LYIKNFVNISYKISKTFKIAILIGGIVLFCISFFGMLTTTFLLEEGMGFFKSYIKSCKIVFKHFFPIAIFWIFQNLLYAFIMILIYVVYSLLIIAGVLILNRADIGTAVYLSTLQILSNGMIWVIVFLYIPLTTLFIHTVYKSYVPKVERKKVILKSYSKYNRVIEYVYRGIFVVCLIITCSFIVRAIKNNPFEKLGIVSAPKITAHRGASITAPENTMSAFTNAIDDVADYIELDVKETKDGVVIVIHDASLKRTTGVNKNVWEVDYDYIKTLDAGSWFSEEYAGEPIPTLEEVIIATKGKIKLNIEIKPTGHDQKLEESVVELIEKYDLVDECVVSSMKYSVIKKVKNLNPKIKTGYIMKSAYGRFYEMKYADFFSVNYSFVTKSIVDKVHNNGKEIHVWTVNGTNNMKELAKMNVDNIITDSPVTCRETVYSRYTNEHILDILKYVFE